LPLQNNAAVKETRRCVDLPVIGRTEDSEQINRERGNGVNTGSKRCDPSIDRNPKPPSMKPPLQLVSEPLWGPSHLNALRYLSREQRKNLPTEQGIIHPKQSRAGMEMGTEGIPATRHTRGLRTLGLRVPPAAPEPRHPPELSGSVRGSLHSGARRGRPVCATSLVVARSSQIKTFQRSTIDRSISIRLMSGDNLFTVYGTGSSSMSLGGLSRLVYDSRLGGINRCWDPGRLPW